MYAELHRATISLQRRMRACRQCQAYLQLTSSNYRLSLYLDVRVIYVGRRVINAVIVEVMSWADHIWYVAVCAQAETARLPQGIACKDLSEFYHSVDFCEWEVGS